MVVAAQFVRATKEGDHDFAAFGQAVIYVDRNRAGDTLLYRNYTYGAARALG